MLHPKLLPALQAQGLPGWAWWAGEVTHHPGSPHVAGTPGTARDTSRGMSCLCQPSHGLIPGGRSKPTPAGVMEPAWPAQQQGWGKGRAGASAWHCH